MNQQQQQLQQNIFGIFYENKIMFSSHENKNSSEYDEQELMRKFLLKFINFFHANHPKDQNIQLFLNEINDQSTPPPMSGFHSIFLPSSSSSSSSEGQGQAVEAQGQSYENILSNLLFWLWDMTRNGYKGKISLIVITNSLSVIKLMNQFKSRGIYVILLTDLINEEIKNEAVNSSNALINMNEVINRGLHVSNDDNFNVENIAEIVSFASVDDEFSFRNTEQVDMVESQSNRSLPTINPNVATLVSPKGSPTDGIPSNDYEKSQYQYPPGSHQTVPVASVAPAIPSGIPATWSEHLQQQKQQGAKPPSLPSLVANKNENANHNVYYDPHSGKPVYANPPRQQPTNMYPPGYGQPLPPHEVPSPSTIDIAASGGFWSTLQKQPMQRWDDPNASNPVSTETLTKEQRVLHDDLVTAIYAYNVNAAVSTLRKMYTKQTRTFRIPTVLGILLPDTAAMIVDGRTDLLNVAVCFALDSIQWCFGVQKGENIESFKYKMNANIARWILHETVKKGIPTTPTPVIQEATISVVNHILENVVELEFAWEMLTTLNISHPVQRIVPHVLAWRGYPNPSIEARVNDFLYDHPEIGSIIPPSHPNPNMHMPPQPSSMQYRSAGGPVSPTTASTSLPPPGNDRTSHMVQAFLRDQRPHPGMDYPMGAPHHPGQPGTHLAPDNPEDPMIDRNLMKLMGRTHSGDVGSRMPPMYRDEFADPMRLRGLEGPPGNDKIYRIKAPTNPSSNPQGNMRGRFPGDNAPGHLDYPMGDEYSMHHHFSNPPPRGVDDVYGRSQVPPQPSNLPRDYPPGRGGFPSGKDLHHFDQEYPTDGLPLEGEDYLGSLGRNSDDDNRNYMFGQQNFDFTLTKDS